MKGINIQIANDKYITLTKKEVSNTISSSILLPMNIKVDDSFKKCIEQKQYDLILIKNSVKPILVHLAEKYPECFDGIVLTYLVVKNVRKGFLFEAFEYKKKKNVKIVLDYAKNQGLYITEETKGKRFLITKEPVNKDEINDVNKDDFLSNVLDFYFKDHDYSNTNINRIGYNIFIEYGDLGASISAMGEAEKTDIYDLKHFLKDRVKRISKVLPAQFRVYYKINFVYSTQFLLDNFNYKFVHSHTTNYMNILYNYWIEGKMSKLFSECLENKRKFEKNKKFLKAFLEYILNLQDFSEEKAREYEEKKI